MSIGGSIGVCPFAPDFSDDFRLSRETRLPGSIVYRRVLVYGVSMSMVIFYIIYVSARDDSSTSYMFNT